MTLSLGTLHIMGITRDRKEWNGMEWKWMLGLWQCANRSVRWIQCWETLFSLVLRLLLSTRTRAPGGRGTASMGQPIPKETTRVSITYWPPLHRRPISRPFWLQACKCSHHPNSCLCLVSRTLTGQSLRPPRRYQLGSHTLCQGEYHAGAGAPTCLITQHGPHFGPLTHVG